MEKLLKDSIQFDYVNFLQIPTLVLLAIICYLIELLIYWVGGSVVEIPSSCQPQAIFGHRVKWNSFVNDKTSVNHNQMLNSLLIRQAQCRAAEDAG